MNCCDTYGRRKRPKKGDFSEYSYSLANFATLARARLPHYAAAICVLTSGSIYAATRSVGIDVSSFQGTVNWSAVKSDGIDFAWAKATEGSASYVNYTDAYLNANMAGANSAGVLIGAYHFAHPINDSGAAGAQAKAVTLRKPKLLHGNILHGLH